MRKGLKLLAGFYLVFLSLVVNAQKNYRVMYKRNDLQTMTINGAKRTISFPLYTLNFNDSLSFFHMYRLLGNLEKTYGREEYHNHATYFLPGPGICYTGAMTGKPKKRQKYLVIDSLPVRNWVALPGSKEILGYSCKGMLSINDTNDSLLVWYAPQIAFPYGPSKYIDFDGLVLEVYDQKFRLRWYATKLDEVSYVPAIPPDARVISKEELLRIKR